MKVTITNSSVLHEGKLVSLDFGRVDIRTVEVSGLDQGLSSTAHRSRKSFGKAGFHLYPGTYQVRGYTVKYPRLMGVGNEGRPVINEPITVS